MNRDLSLLVGFAFLLAALGFVALSATTLLQGNPLASIKGDESAAERAASAAVYLVVAVPAYFAGRGCLRRYRRR